MTSDKLEAAIERLREVDAEAANVIEELVLAAEESSNLADELIAWRGVASKLARTVAVYQTYSPN